MKKYICCILIAVVAVTAGAQGRKRLVPLPDSRAVPKAGQSELVIKSIGTLDMLVSINGAKAAYLFPGETIKIFVNNGSVSVEAQNYYYPPKKRFLGKGTPDINNTTDPFVPYGKAASLVINLNSQSVQIELDNRTYNAKIEQGAVKPLQIQNTETQPQNAYSNSAVADAVKYGTEEMIERIPPMSTVAVISIASRDREMTEYIIREVENILVNSSLTVVDRRRLETAMQEQKFQMTGDIDDKSAVSIGKLLEADIVITGSVSGSGTARRLRLTAINVQTEEIAAMTSERF